MHAGGLHPPSTAVTVDATGAETKRVPGPFVEATEYVGGFWVIKAVDEEAAITWAEQASAALQSRIEVRASRTTLSSAPERHRRARPPRPSWYDGQSGEAPFRRAAAAATTIQLSHHVGQRAAFSSHRRVEGYA